MSDTVYISVTELGYDGIIIEGVFTTKEAAIACITGKHLFTT